MKLELPEDLKKWLDEENARREAYQKERNRKPYWKKLGVVDVDSGQLMICDPCYGTKAPKINYDKLTLQDHSLQINHKTGHAGAGLLFHTFGGDGSYEVWAKIKECQISEIKIKFYWV